MLSSTIDITMYNGMGVHATAIDLPVDSLGFVGFVDEPTDGAAYLNDNDPTQVIYHSAGVVGVQTFEFIYLDAQGDQQFCTVNVTTVADPNDPSGSGEGAGSGSGGGSGSGSTGTEYQYGYGLGGATGDGSGTPYEFEYEYGYGYGGASGSESGIDNSSDAENAAVAAAGSGTTSGSGSGSGSGTATSTDSSVYLPPVAVIWGTRPEVPYRGTLQLKGTQSHDQDNLGTGDPIIAYQWDLDGDGYYDDSSSSTLSLTWSQILAYGGVPGANYTARLKVTDNEWAVDTDTFTTQLGNLDYLPPVAAIQGATSVPYGGTLSLSGTGSRDLDTFGTGPEITAYKWDLDGDGAFDDFISTTASTLSLTWNQIINYRGVAGSNYTVKLQVTDNDTGINTMRDTETLIVGLGSPPPPPTVTVTAQDASASEVGPDPGSLKFTRTGSTSAALVVSYTLGGTAINGTDYQTAAVTVTIAAGQSTKTLAITPKTDTLVEGNETVIATLSANSAYVIGTSSTATITIQDKPANQLPVITSNGGGPTAAITVNENQTAVTDVQSSDPDGSTENGGGLTYSLTGGADLAKFAINANTGVLTFITAPNYESPTDVGANNTYGVQVTVTGPTGRKDAQGITVSVVSVSEPPVITSDGGGATASVTVSEGTTFVTDVQSTDQDGTLEGPGGLTYSITGGKDRAKFEINANTGVLSFKTAPDFETPTDRGANNVYDVEVTVKDPGGLPDKQEIAVTVVNVNEAPTITSNGGGATAAISIPENQREVTNVQSTDPDGTLEGPGGLTYAITGGADQAKFSIVADTGVLEFITAPDRESPTDSDKNNVYDVQVTVSDPGPIVRTDAQDIAVTITNTNEAPDFDPLDDTYTVKLGRNKEKGKVILDGAGHSVSHATDPDGGSLTYSIVSGNEDGLFQINASTGELSLTVKGTAVAGSSYSLQIKAKDPGGMSDLATVNITVVDAVGVSGDTHAVEGSPDDIVVRFIRYSHDPSAGALTAKYEIRWYGTATIADFEHTTDRTKFSSTIVTFIAGETEKSITLSASADVTIESIERFAVIVSPDPDGTTNGMYVPIPNNESSEVPGVGHDAIVSFSFLYFYILDGVTLFAKQDISGNAVDDVNGDDVTNGSDLQLANPGIYFDDINQGNLGDCWLMAAMAALTRENWQQIESRFTAAGDGYDVNLWDGNSWDNYHVSMDLVRGNDMASLSGDVDADGKAEIWPILLEAAYAQMVGSYQDIDQGNNSGNLYSALTGVSPTALISTSGKSDLQIWTEVRDALAAGYQVVLNTNTNQPSGSQVRGHHAYLVLAALSDGFLPNGDTDYRFVLYNPWGGDGSILTVKISGCSSYFSSYSILDDVH